MYLKAVFTPGGNGSLGRGTIQAACVGTAALPDVVDQLRHDLDRTGTGADHRHPLPGQVDVVVPLGGMEGGTAEVVEAGDIGECGMCSAPAPSIRNCATYS